MALFRMQRKNGFSLALLPICSASLFILAGALSAIGATITGVVTDSSTGAPIANVLVQAVGSFHQDSTDSLGRFSIGEMPSVVSNSRSIASRGQIRLTGRSIAWNAA
jgi:hypothetical protein